MRFYYDIHSKDGIAYIPSGFTISVGKEHMDFDLEGNVECSADGGKITGELSVHRGDDYIEASEKDINDLKALVKEHHLCTVYVCASDDADHSGDSITGFTFTLYVYDELIMNEDHCDVEVC